MTDDAHIEYVTGQVRDWFEQHHKAKITEWLDEVARMNQDAGNIDCEDEDLEWLSGQMEDFTARQLIAPLESGIVKWLLSDALSEAEWLDLAAEYYYQKEQ